MIKKSNGKERQWKRDGQDDDGQDDDGQDDDGHHTYASAFGEATQARTGTVEKTRGRECVEESSGRISPGENGGGNRQMWETIQR